MKKLYVDDACMFVREVASQLPIAHFTVVCLVTWPWIGSEAGATLSNARCPEGRSCLKLGWVSFLFFSW